MLNRRHLRIKVLQALYAFYQSEETDYGKAQKDLFKSLDYIYQLYFYLLLSFEELKSIAETRVEDNKTKIRPTAEDLNPNLKFIENKVFTSIANTRELRRLSEENHATWITDENREMFRKMFLQIKESELYFAYMNSEDNSFEEDLEFAINLFKQEIANSELMYHFFEEKNIHWMDDIDLACSMALKTIKSVKVDEEFEVLPLFKDPEDEIPFTKTLLQKTIVLDKENTALIDELTDNWDMDRIAKMDVILMKMAITEFQEMKEIPTKVTLNEYIEISKFYSTPKSNGFINGILDKAIDRLKKEDKINKVGRGLMN